MRQRRKYVQGRDFSPAFFMRLTFHEKKIVANIHIYVIKPTTIQLYLFKE